MRVRKPEGDAYDRNPKLYQAKSRLRRGKMIRRTAIVTFFVMLAAIVATSLFAARNVMSSIADDIDDGGVADQALSSHTIEAGKDIDPFYMLLMGTDRSAERASSAEYGEDEHSYRTDSMILVRVDPKSKSVSMVSMHRDTMVEINGRKQKLNASYSIGGVPGAVKAISSLADVPISHYATIDFDGFAAVVDALGGVDVDVPIDIDDPDEYTGLKLSAGMQHIDGNTALQLCRARHTYDQIGDGDVFRASNQRRVLSAIAEKVLASDMATKTGTVMTMARYVKTDLSVDQIIDIALALSGMQADDIYSGMEPTVSDYVDETWYEQIDRPAWQAMMSRVDLGLSPYPANHEAAKGTETASSKDRTDDGAYDFSGAVAVYDASNVMGSTNALTAMLKSAGFETPKADVAAEGTGSHVWYDPATDGALARANAIGKMTGLSVAEMTSSEPDPSMDRTSGVIVVLGQAEAEELPLLPMSHDVSDHATSRMVDSDEAYNVISLDLENAEG